MLVGEAPRSLLVEQHILLRFTSLPFQIVCSLPRFPSFKASRLVEARFMHISRKALVNNCRFFVQPNNCRTPSQQCPCFTRTIQSVLQTVLILQSPSHLVNRLCDCCTQHIPLSYTRKYLRHLKLLENFPSMIIGEKNWVHKLLEEVKAANKTNQNLKSNCQELGYL